MRAIIALLIGALTGAAAALLHLALAPWGLILALVGSWVTIWSIGRLWGKRKLKVFASAAWVVAIFRAGTLGAGNEILVQGDTYGGALLMIGFVGLLVVSALRA